MPQSSRYQEDRDEPILAVDGLAKQYGGRPALDGTTFFVRAGEFLALLGPNGAGKTTLIRSICGRVRPDAGQITFRGRSLRWRRDRRHIGFVPQDLAVYFDLSARENMLVFARLHGVPRHRLREAVDEALEWTGLADRQHQLVGTFSGGMKRRVNIACGVLHRPRLVLLDEPTVGVDPQSREKIFEMLETMRSRGTAFLITTHHLEEAETRCDRIVVIDHGQVVAEGDVATLIDQTIGNGSRVQLRLSAAPPEQSVTQLAAVGVNVNGDGQTVTKSMANVATELPELMTALAGVGCEVYDVRVEPPSLQKVFLHLTGRELRD